MDDVSLKKCPSGKKMVDYIEGDLSKEKSTQLKKHIAKCPVCKDVVKTVIKIKKEVEEGRVVE